jgi:ribosomal protein L34
MAARAIGRQQAQHAGLLARVLIAYRRGGAAVGVALFLRRLDTRNGRDVGYIPRFATLEGLKILAPLGGYRRGVG